MKTVNSMQEYGTGRARLGIGREDGNDVSPTVPLPSLTSAPNSAKRDETAPKLGEYLQFGKLIGERVQDVQRQLDINGARVQIDQESLEMLQDWQNEQKNAYAMFEALVDEQLRGNAAASEKDTLLRNKNRVCLTHTSRSLFNRALKPQPCCFLFSSLFNPTDYTRTIHASKV
jgi:hypothetical protein